MSYSAVVIELHRKVGLDSVTTSGSIGDVMLSTLVSDERDVVSIPALGAMFPIFITPTTLVAITWIMYN